MIFSKTIESLLKAIGITRDEPSQKIVVLPELGLAERILAGQYDQISPGITDDYLPLPDLSTVGHWECKLYDHRPQKFGPGLKQKVEGWGDGWTIAQWEQLLAYGSSFPDAQREHIIVAAGSVCGMRDTPGQSRLRSELERMNNVGNGCRSILGLWHEGDKRILNLFDGTEGSRGDFRFLLVRHVGA